MKISQLPQYIDVLNAAAQGKTIQWRFRGHGDNSWINVSPDTALMLDMNNHEVRVKPEHKFRPWKPSEVPIGAWTKFFDPVTGISEDTETLMILGMRESGVILAGEKDGITYSYGGLLSMRKYSIDQGKTWHKCGVLE